MFFILQQFPARFADSGDFYQFPARFPRFRQSCPESGDNSRNRPVTGFRLTSGYPCLTLFGSVFQFKTHGVPFPNPLIPLNYQHPQILALPAKNETLSGQNETLSGQNPNSQFCTPNHTHKVPKQSWEHLESIGVYSFNRKSLYKTHESFKNLTENSQLEYYKNGIKHLHLWYQSTPQNPKKLIETFKSENKAQFENSQFQKLRTLIFSKIIQKFLKI